MHDKLMRWLTMNKTTAAFVAKLSAVVKYF